MNGHEQSGFSLIEMLATVAIAALVLAALAGVAGQATRAREAFGASAELEQQAQFAMERMVRAVRGTSRLLVPRPENAATPYSESVRDVLGMALDPTLDSDGDGFVDADNDKDGRIDEDFGDDMTNDGAAGIVGVDDDGDGLVDEGDPNDDDEDGTTNEDKLDGIDNDGDGLIDEDVSKDMSNDGKPGIAGVDDDGDGFIDEGAIQDDDEDGKSDEDWIDVVVYRLSGTTLLERLPNPNPVNGNDFTERPIAEGVTLFRVEYLPPAAAGRPAVVDITLTLGGAGGATASLNTRVRAGGAL
ncbi:MAG TPA: prepilin-type N-terminal cleavage/methylation domain-containing protein [Gammaproteobacteria bacterium]|nr:prepilin-type N-terminal cleavage/methylation domain-containing protein [Gammaproteobacteria bacterium]